MHHQHKYLFLCVLYLHYVSYCIVQVEKLKLDIPIHFLPWLTPNHEESFEAYVRRFSAQVDRADGSVLIGVSFGGMIALELSRFLNFQKVILISSAVEHKQVFSLFRGLGKMGLFQILPKWLLVPPGILRDWLFGVVLKPERLLLRAIIKDTDLIFLRWALFQIANWKPKQLPENLQIIHGTADRLLKPPAYPSTVRIKGGGHLMILDRADEISAFINQELTYPLV